LAYYLGTIRGEEGAKAIAGRAGELGVFGAVRRRREVSAKVVSAGRVTCGEMM
jgi:hypothetical protein